MDRASIVVPVAGVAIAKGSAWPIIPLGLAALAYLRCVWTCAAALLPQNIEVGLLGGEMLKLAADTGADAEQMQASASSYMDGLYRDNQLILEKASENVKHAVIALGIEIVALTAAIPVTLLTRDANTHPAQTGSPEPDAAGASAERDRSRDPLA